MKRFLGLALCLIMTLGLFTACNKQTSSRTSSASSTNETSAEALNGTVVFLTNRTDLDTDGTFDTLISRFNKKYPNITIKVESSTDYTSEIVTRMQTKEYGDVCMITDAIPSKDLGKYFEPFGTVDELKDKYREEYLYSKWYNGQVYGLANMCVVKGLVYNKQVFRDAGITTLPTTEDEFLTDLQMIKDNTSAIPYYTNANVGWTLDQWEDHAFGSITGSDTYKNNDMPHDKEAFAEGSSHWAIAKLVYEIVKRGLCEKDPTTCDWEASKGMLNRGEIGCMLLGSWAIQQIKDAGICPDNVGYMPYPHSVNGKQYASSDADYCYGININSQNKKAARAWVDFLVDESGLALKNGGISLLKSDPLPESLENFENVTLIVDKPATDENIGLLDAVQQESGVTLYDNGVRLNAIIDIARGASNDTFEAYMKRLNDAWAAAVQ
jgi:raffinose/stachyose/melibiose transport system substrate-binding protein